MAKTSYNSKMGLKKSWANYHAGNEIDLNLKNIFLLFFLRRILIFEISAILYQIVIHYELFLKKQKIEKWWMLIMEILDFAYIN